jgi:hypothetical protein
MIQKHMKIIRDPDNILVARFQCWEVKVRAITLSFIFCLKIKEMG